jgi:hypothetical protein
MVPAPAQTPRVLVRKGPVLPASTNGSRRADGRPKSFVYLERVLWDLRACSGCRHIENPLGQIVHTYFDLVWFSCQVEGP